MRPELAAIERVLQTVQIAEVLLILSELSDGADGDPEVDR